MINISAASLPFLQPQHRLHIDDDPLQGKGQSVKEFILRDDLQPQMAAGQRPFFKCAQDHFVQYQMHDHGGEQDNAEDNHQRAGGGYFDS